MFVDTSAKTNTNVVELFRKVAERVLQFKQDTPIPVTPGASIDESGQVLKKAPRSEQAAAAAPKRRDKRTKNDEFLLQKSTSDVVESKSDGGIMCGIGDQYLCGQQHDVGTTCIIL
jgi:hypothetical protein